VTIIPLIKEQLSSNWRIEMDKSVSSMLETVGRVFEATFHSVDSMSHGERIQLKELAQTVGLAVAMDPKDVLGFVNYYVHNSDIVYVSRGKNGGVIKGSRSAKPAAKIKIGGQVPGVPLVEPDDANDE
jgi:hypothetical protein